jgi:hypothetical protein
MPLDAIIKFDSAVKLMLAVPGAKATLISTLVDRHTHEKYSLN